MPPIVVRAEELVASAVVPQPDGGSVVAFTDGGCAVTFTDGGCAVTFTDDAVQLRAELRKLWVCVLLMALRDRATSVHYHPWRNDGRLTYVIEGFRRYELVPPPAEYAPAIIEAARSLFTAPPNAGFLARVVGRAPERAVCSSFTFEGWGWSVLWDAVCWSNGERTGVELIRVTPLEDAQPV